MRAQPVVDDADVDARARLRGERIGKLAPDFVIRDDVILEQYRVLGAADGGQPRRIVLPRVLQQPYGVAVDRRRASGAGKRTVGEPEVGQTFPLRGHAQVRLRQHHLAGRDARRETSAFIGR